MELEPLITVITLGEKKLYGNFLFFIGNNDKKTIKDSRAVYSINATRFEVSRALKGLRKLNPFFILSNGLGII